MPEDGTRSTGKDGRDHVRRTTLSDGGSRVNRRRFLSAAGASGALAVFAGCIGGDDDGGDDGGDGSDGGDGGDGGSTPLDRPGDLEEVRMSFVPSSATAPIWIAEDRGYFEERGIELVPDTSVSGAQATAQLATGQLDIAVGAVGASTFNAIADDVPIKLSADEASSTPGLPVGNRYYIHPDLYEDGMTLEDVEPPVTFALNVTAAVSEYMLARAIAAVDNLSWDNVEVETLPFPQMISAMESGAIDIAQQIDPLGPLMAREIGAEFIDYSNWPAPEVFVAGIIVGGPFQNQRRDVARKWHEAYILGIREYHELRGLGNEEVATLTADALDNPVESTRTSIPYLHNKNGRVPIDDVMTHQQFLACQGYVEAQVPEEDVFAIDLLEEALDEIGRVPEDEERVDVSGFEEYRDASPADWPETRGHPDLAEFPTDDVCGNPP